MAGKNTSLNMQPPSTEQRYEMFSVSRLIDQRETSVFAGRSIVPLSCLVVVLLGSTLAFGDLDNSSL